MSDSSNLVPGSLYGHDSILVKDRLLGAIARVDVAVDGTHGFFSNNPSISADGRFVAFTSASWQLVSGDTNGQRDIFVTRNPLAVVAGDLNDDGKLGLIDVILALRIAVGDLAPSDAQLKAGGSGSRQEDEPCSRDRPALYYIGG